MNIAQIAAEALRVPPKERAMLAESLWENLADPFKVAASADDMEAVALATERDRQLEAGEVQPVSHEEMMGRCRSVEYHPAVETELREIQQYYDKQSPGLGTQFIDEIERQVLPNAVRFAPPRRSSYR